MSDNDSLNTSHNYPLALMDNIMTQDYANETLIYNLKTDKMFHLNETSSLVWQFCDGRSSIDQISRKVSQKLNSHANAEMVWLALEQLQHNGLLDQNNALEADLKRVSRRDMIKKAGLATMVAFPLITSVVAPTAVSAASGSPNVACTSNCGGVLGLVCGCTNVTCSNGNIVNINAGLGLCVSAAAALNLYGVSAAAGANGNVCVGLGVCL